MRGEGIVPVMEVGNNNNGFGGYGNGDWAWIIILFLIFGNGRGFGNGFGGNGGGYSGVPDNFALQTDFATLERKLDAVNAGICDSTFNLNSTMTNGFAGVQQTLCQGFSGINQNIVTNGYETRLATQGLSSQLANCCCDIRQQISDCCCTTQRGLDAINYNNAINTNSIQQTLCNNTRDIIENQNANYRALHEELIANKLEAKNDRIAELTAQVNKLQLSASQERQNNYLISQLGEKCPVPAFVVNGPTPVNFPTNCCNTFSGFNSCGNY